MWICFLSFRVTFAVFPNSKSFKPKGAVKHHQMRTGRGDWKTILENKQMSCASTCRLILKEFPHFLGHAHPEMRSGFLCQADLECAMAYL